MLETCFNHLQPPPIRPDLGRDRHHLRVGDPWLSRLQLPVAWKTEIWYGCG